MQIHMVLRQWYFDIPEAGEAAEEMWREAKSCQPLSTDNYSDRTRTIFFRSIDDIPQKLKDLRANSKVQSRIGEIGERLALLRRLDNETIRKISKYVGLSAEQNRQLEQCLHTPNVLDR